MTQAPGYVEFVKERNPRLVNEYVHARRIQHLGEKALERHVKHLEAHERHAHLIEEEVHQAVVSARGRLQSDPWPHGHHATPLPPDLFAPPSPRTPKLPPRKGPSTLVAAPGTMFSAETAKGRARRLAAKLGKGDFHLRSLTPATRAEPD